jgi:hypothetical protein
MSNIPIPFIQGATEAEKVTEIASYLKSLSSAVERELMSIDSTNLNGDLRARIESSLTEHQDLTGFASKNYLKNHFYEKEHIENLLKLRVTLSELNGILSDYAKKDECFDKTSLDAYLETDWIGDMGEKNYGSALFPKYSRYKVKDYIDDKIEDLRKEVT